MAIEEMIWEFLRIDPMYVSGVFLNDIINLVVVPTAVLLIFLEFAVELFARDNKWIKHVLAFAFYALLIVQGYYAPFAVFVGNYVIIFLILAAAVFFTGRLITFRGGVATAAGAKIVYDSLTERNKRIRDVQRELDHLRKSERFKNDRLRYLIRHHGATPPPHIKFEIEQLQPEIQVLRQEILNKEYEMAKLKRP
jgi:cell division protein FtsB